MKTNIVYCHKCNLSNQQPTSTNEYFHTKDTRQQLVKFNDKNICAACEYNEKKYNSIDWNEREKELIELLNKYRKNDGSYDCLVSGSGGKDSIFAAWILKYKYKMSPLTVTWAPHLYTQAGKENMDNWIFNGGFDNILFTPNPKIHKRITREATLNLLHPFQPFILGQKSFVVKYASKMNIPLIFYGESPADYGKNVGHKSKSFGDKYSQNQPGYSLDPLEGKDFKDCYLGGKQVGSYLDEGLKLVDFASYKPITLEEIEKKKLKKYYLGYFLKWVPQNNYYFSVEKTNFVPSKYRLDGTFQKYASLDDKLDGFFFYTRYIKFGVGRAMMDAAQEIRNGFLTKDEGLRLINKYDGEYPKTYEKEFLDYVNLTQSEFKSLCDSFRGKNVWTKKNNKWKLRVSCNDYFKKYA